MDYWHKKWVCPFFKWDDRLSVHCERGNTVSMPTAKAATRYMDAHCASMDGWCRCSIAACLLQYYDEKDGQNEKTE